MSNPGDDDGLSPMARAERGAMPYVNAVWKLIGGIGVGTAAGLFLDAKLHSSPWGLLGLSFLGAGTGFYAFIRAVTVLGQKR